MIGSSRNQIVYRSTINRSVQSITNTNASIIPILLHCYLLIFVGHRTIININRKKRNLKTIYFNIK